MRADWRNPRPACAAIGLLALLASLGTTTGHTRAPGSAFRFVDVAPDAGVTRVLLAGRPAKDHLLDSAGAGAAWLDYDRDGRLDLFLPNGWRLDGPRIVERGRYALYRGLSDGTFRDVTDAAGVQGDGRWGAGAFVADYDQDGWPDILVTTFGRNLLYRNLGNGRFEDVAARVGIESPGWNTGAAFFDADGDGDLDLYRRVVHRLHARRRARREALRSVGAGSSRSPSGRSGSRGRPITSSASRAASYVDATAEAGLAGSGARDSASPCGRLTSTTTETSMSTSRTTPTPTTSIATRATGSSRRWAPGRGARSTGTARPRPAWALRSATRRAMAIPTSSSPTSPRTSPPCIGASATARSRTHHAKRGSRRPPIAPCRGERRSPTSTTTAISTSSSRTATSIRRSIGTRRWWARMRSGTSCSRTWAPARRRSFAMPRRRPERGSSRCARAAASPSATTTTTATSTC